jgi:hypothetical protein
MDNYYLIGGNNMKWFSLIGLILILGIAIAPSVNADMKVLEIKTMQEQRLIELIEGMIVYYSDSYNSIYVNDCGCDDQGTTEWRNPVRCFFLGCIFIVVSTLLILGINLNLYNTIEDMGKELNCRWI